MTNHTVTFSGECSCSRSNDINREMPAQAFVDNSKIHVRCAECRSVVPCHKVGL